MTIEIVNTPEGPQYIECFGDDYYGESWPVADGLDSDADNSPSDGKLSLASEPYNSLAASS